MSDFYIYDLPQNRSKRTTIVFSTRSTPSQERLLGQLREYYKTVMPADKIILLVPARSSAAFMSLIDERFLDILPGVSKYVNPPSMNVVGFDGQGRLTYCYGRTGNVGTRLGDLIRAQGLWTIVDRHQGMMTAGAGFHFAKPSRWHSAHFLRTANILVNSTEIEFMAVWLLSLFSREIDIIHVDTATILSLPYAVFRLKSLFAPDYRPPHVESFRSYEGLGESQLLGGSRAICLVSAATAHTMIDTLVVKHDIPRDNIIAILYCGRDTTRVPALLNLRRRPGTLDSYERIENYPEEECPLCLDGSRPIYIAGEQLVGGERRVKSIVPAVRHLDKQARDSFEMFVGKGVFSAHCPDTAGNRREVYAHMERALEDGGAFERRFNRLVNHMLPASVKLIIHPNDDGSVALASRVHEFLETKGIRDGVELLSQRELEKEEREINDGSIVVVSSVVVSGVSLMGLSQSIRGVSKNGNIVYIIGLVRTESPELWRELRANVGYGELPGEHPVGVVATMHLPTEVRGRTPWMAEHRFWIRMRSRYREENEWIAERIRELEGKGLSDARAKPELLDNLYLKAIQENGEEKSLEIRPGFALWDFDWTTVTQSDVHASILAFLNALRRSRDPEERLVQYDNERTLLNPSTFMRYNDGIIQSAFLRSATQAELDYSLDNTLSAMMVDLMTNLFNRCGEDEGEATPEFMLALATGKMHLTGEDGKAIERHLQSVELPPHLTLLRKEIGRRYTE